MEWWIVVAFFFLVSTRHPMMSFGENKKENKQKEKPEKRNLKINQEE